MEKNNTALNLLGWDLHEFIGRNLHETVHHSEHDGRPYSWNFALCTPVLKTVPHITVGNGDYFWRKDGSNFVADFIVCPSPTMVPASPRKF